MCNNFYMDNVLVVNNSNAGRKQALKCKKILLNFFIRNKKNYKFIDVHQLKDINTDDFNIIIAVGGDGTVNKIVPHILGSDKILGIIPCGTANLLAAKVGIPDNVKKALKIIEKGNTSLIDCFKINDKYSVLRIGFGFDSDIICKTPQSLKNKFGYLAYFFAGLLFSLKLKQKKYNITFDDNKKLSVVATCIIVANAGNMFKNFVSVSKNCKLDDGLADIFILKADNPFLFFFEFLNIIFGKKSSNSKAIYFQCSNISIKNDFCSCHIDGEKQKIKDNININIIPKSVKIFSK